jgi:transposase
MSRNRYPEEFKIEAVKQVTEAGYSAYDVAELLGTTTNSLYSWIRRYGPNASDFSILIFSSRYGDWVASFACD